MGEQYLSELTHEEKDEFTQWRLQNLSVVLGATFNEKQMLESELASVLDLMAELAQTLAALAAGVSEADVARINTVLGKYHTSKWSKL